MATTQTTLDAPGRMIFALMFFTVAFALVSKEITSGNKSDKQVPGTAFGIIFGGTIATASLTLLSHAGDPGERFATGLALVTFISGMLIYGAPVFDAANKQFGSTPTTPVTSTTPSTSETAAVVAVASAA